MKKGAAEISRVAQIACKIKKQLDNPSVHGENVSGRNRTNKESKQDTLGQKQSVQQMASVSENRHTCERLQPHGNPGRMTAHCCKVLAELANKEPMRHRDYRQSHNAQDIEDGEGEI